MSDKPNNDIISLTNDIIRWSFKAGKTVISRWNKGSFKQIKVIHDSRCSKKNNN